jgi:hypothetical protein
MEAPKGLILFMKTHVGKDLHSKYNTIVVMIFLSSSFTAILGYFLHYTLIIISAFLALIALRTWVNGDKMVNIPLAVNLNHPFMLEGSMGKAEAMVGFDGWKDPETNRFLLYRENAMNVWQVMCQDSEKSLFSIWNTTYPEKILRKQIAIINQALALCDAANEMEDDFEDARERENEDSGLLDREWMPDEEIEVQGPISRMFTKE